ncbi:Outer membrane protein TolC [Dyadobacter sp. SG02]|uniref:TolC family protein n=1 Tax=Dyadobacter sp. SG02 TaxID=1855291 RepID=UPI0008B66BF2|nr:TolC family protein [Dyadobacter sp. SG02]SEI66082.1 Outer membrane protein TolC [Dyadobacter sp. SG02]
MKHSQYHSVSRFFPPGNAHSPAHRIFGIKNRWLALLFAVFACVQANAQHIKLHEALEQGKGNFPFLKAKQAEIHSAESRIKSVKTDYLPAFIVQDQYTYATSNSVAGAFLPNEGSALSPSGGIRPENIYTPTFGSFTTAMVDWKVFNFGKINANVNAAKADLARTQADYENELFQHQVKIIDAYLLLLINQKLVDAQRQNLERAAVFKRVTDAAVTSGMRPGVDSSLAAAEYAKAQLLLLESQRSEKAQRLRFSELTGELHDSIAVDTMGFYAQLPVASSEIASFLKNPALRFSQAQIDASVARSLAVKRSYLPSVSLVGAGWGRGSGVSNKDDSFRTDFGSGVKYQVYNYLVGVSTRWNLTNIFKVRNDYHAEQFQAERFKSLYKTQQLQLDRQSRESEIQFQLSLAQARLTPVQLAAARTAFNQAEARYQSGLTDLFTLAQSVNALNRAEIDKFVTNGNAWRSLLLKAAAAGDLDIFLSQINN